MKKFLKSLFTDADWDADVTKIIGFILIGIGIAGYFMNKDDFKWLIVTGAAALSSGKLSGNE